MRNGFTLINVLFLLCVAPLNIAPAKDFQVGQQVVLQATKPVGVPLHRHSSPSYFKHVPNGTPATIQRIAQDDHWLSIQLGSGDAHWVHKKYVRLSKPVPLVPPLPSSSTIPAGSKTTLGGEQDVWTNPAQCQAAIHKGLRMAHASSATLRLATWNLRWFPVGSSPDQSRGSAESTDLDWLLCSIRWMQVDILAIQESLATPKATQALKTLTSRLSTQTGEAWKWYRQPCGRPDDHHIGFLWNDSRVALSTFTSLWHFNSKARSAKNPCTAGLRPGQYAYAQSRRKDGADFHLIAVHLKSGPTVFALEERQKALNRIDKAVAPLLSRDRDVVILGDFNTMGAGDRHSQRSELKYLRRFVAKEQPGFADLPVQPQCSHYFRGRGAQLDHILVPKAMKEVHGASVQVTGYCALTGCQRIRGEYPLAYRRLSDHCPIVLEVSDHDDD